jgi:adenosylcobyric acid synthase
MLDFETSFTTEKHTMQRRGQERGSAIDVSGYEIRHGHVSAAGSGSPWFELATADGGVESEGVVSDDRTFYGTSLHGLLETDLLRSRLLAEIARRRDKTWTPSGVSFAQLRTAQVDIVADACEQHLDLDALWRIIAEADR